MDYLTHLFILIGIYLILAQSFNLVFGLGGLLNLAHGGVYAIGAYTTALLATEAGYSFWVCLPLSCAVSALVAFPLGAIALRLSQDYFAIGTLALGYVIQSLLINWRSLTRGVLGIPGIPRPHVFGVELNDNTSFLIFVLVINLIVLTTLGIIFNSPFSRRLRAQASYEAAAATLGSDVARMRTVAFVLATAFAGLAGALFAYYLSFIDPSSFGLNEMILILTITVVGGPGSFFGNIVATVFLLLLPEALRFVELPSSILGPMRQILYSAVLFVVVYLKREKLFPQKREV